MRPAPTAYRLVRVPALNAAEQRLGVPYPLFAPALLPVLRREVAQADVVHGHGLLYQSSALGLWLARRAPRRPVRAATEHVGHVAYASPVLDAAQRLAFATLGRATARSAQGLVVLNAKVEEEVRALAPDRTVERIGNGVDAVRYRPAAPGERAALRAGLGWDDRPRVLFVGRLVAKKGLDHALAAAAEAAGAWELVVVGPGDPPAALPPAAQVVGPLPPERVRRPLPRRRRLPPPLARRGLPHHGAGGDGERSCLSCSPRSPATRRTSPARARACASPRPRRRPLPQRWRQRWPTPRPGRAPPRTPAARSPGRAPRTSTRRCGRGWHRPLRNPAFASLLAPPITLS